MSTLSQAEILARIESSVELALLDLAERDGQRSKTHFVYMSFVDNNRPVDQRWVGGCYIPADSADEARLLSNLLEINPGGEVLMTDILPLHYIKMEYTDRLLTSKEEIEAASAT